MNETRATRELTADGSATLYRADIDEHYHSVKGAVAESLHVYVDCGLRHRAEKTDRPLTLLEIGFGTGLNAALSVGKVDNPIHYISLELYPLPQQTALSLGYADKAPAIAEIIAAQWNSPVHISPTFTLEKRICDFIKCDLPEGIDVVYFDAFAPEKQPEMWLPENFQRIFKAMNPGGVLTTYCAKGAIRRMLESVGFTVERLPGPEGGKREILRATKPFRHGC